MTFVNAFVLYLSLQLFSQAQAAVGPSLGVDEPYGNNETSSSVISPTHTTTSTFGPKYPQVKSQNHGDYSWYFPTETSPGIRHASAHHPRPLATGTDPDHSYIYHSSYPPRPTESGSYYHSSVTNSTSAFVIVPTTGTGSRAVSLSSTRSNDSVSHVNPTSTLIEKVTLVPIPSPTSRWVTKRSVTVSSRTPPIALKPTTTLKRFVTVSSRTPSTALKPTTTLKSSLKPSLAATCPSGKFYTVVSGDTCTKIATKEKVPVGKLISLNKLPSTCSTLQIGQKLCLPVCKAYTVQPGDFCFKISNKFNIELSDLLTANP